MTKRVETENALVEAFQSPKPLENKREELIYAGKKMWEMRKWIYYVSNKQKVTISDIPNKEVKRILREVYRRLGTKVPLEGGLSGLFGENSLEYSMSHPLTRYALAAFVEANYEAGIDMICEESFEFQYKDSLQEDDVICAYLSIGNKKKARAVVQRLKGINEVWSLSRAVSDARHCLKDEKLAEKLEKQLELLKKKEEHKRINGKK